MAPLPVESTARYVVHYVSGGNQHTQLYRFAPPPSPATLAPLLDAIWTAASPILVSTTIEDVVFYPDESTVGSPVAMPGFIGETYGSGTPGNVGAALFLNFVARSTGGRRVRLAFFSPEGTDPSWRFTAGENADVDATIDALEALPALVGIDSQPLVWKQYANVGYNAYWQRELRS